MDPVTSPLPAAEAAEASCEVMKIAKANILLRKDSDDWLVKNLWWLDFFKAAKVSVLSQRSPLPWLFGQKMRYFSFKLFKLWPKNFDIK